MKVIPGRTKVIVTIEDIKDLVADCIAMNKSDFDLEISDLPSGKSDLWYPDDSGKWVEVDPESMTMPSELQPDTIITILIKQECDSKRYSPCVARADDFCWNNHPTEDSCRIVAYKIVE